jgi:hypothetical protein
MKTEPIVTYEDISKALDIPRDRYRHIVRYITQMLKDYKGAVVDIVKEIPLNLKGKERHFAMFTIGRFTSPSFSSIDDERQKEFITDIIDTLKISQEMAGLITSDIQNRIPKGKKGDINTSTTDIMKEVIDGDLKDVEKDYISFVLGLVYV